MYLFENGRKVYNKKLLKKEDEGKCIEIEKLPRVEVKENEYVFYYADLENKAVLYEVREIEGYVPESPIEEPEPETPQEPIPTPLETISEQLKSLSEKYESDQNYTQEMMLTLASAIAEVYERLDAEASK